jgi:hypothetical protein
MKSEKLKLTANCVYDTQYTSSNEKSCHANQCRIMVHLYYTLQNWLYLRCHSISYEVEILARGSPLCGKGHWLGASHLEEDSVTYVTWLTSNWHVGPQTVGPTRQWLVSHVTYSTESHSLPPRVQILGVTFLYEVKILIALAQENKNDDLKYTKCP